MFYRLPDIISGVMAQPFYIEKAFTLTEIANVTKVYGVIVGILGAFVGGLSVIRLGMNWTLLIGGIIGAASNLMFTWLALSGPERVAMPFFWVANGGVDTGDLMLLLQANSGAGARSSPGSPSGRRCRCSCSASRSTTSPATSRAPPSSPTCRA
ncbi:hypothetical protein GCM10025880_16180 [Methylorubrum aminovorans]|nr:hypothetical protein [Methylorubrum aminovorans]GMA75201.1 hypothetical protein GCM10025880_16180 [Methylorubrum aminovorans]